MRVVMLAAVAIIALTRFAWADAGTFGYYSAIAIDPITGAYGYSTGWLFDNQARGDALRRCRSNPNGQHCRGALVFNSCGAVTAGTRDYYFGVGLNQDLANSRAVNACSTDGNQSCKIIISFCSAEGQAPPPGVPAPRSTPTSPSQSQPRPACPYGTQAGLGGCYGY